VLQKESEPWLKSLTEEEKYALRKYTYNSRDGADNRFYKRLNAMLRGDIPKDENLERYANIISGALKKSSLPGDVVCYRGLDINPVAGVLEGSIVNLHQFISTSVEKRKAFKKKVQIKIYAKKGTHAGYIETLSSFSEQKELLLDKDFLYRVLSNRDNIIELEVI